jgi:hypothetical protein
MSGYDDGDRKKAGVLPHDPKVGTIPFGEWEAKEFPENKAATVEAAAPSAAAPVLDHDALVAEVVAASRSEDPAAVDKVLEQHRALISKMGGMTLEAVVDLVRVQARHLPRPALSMAFRKAAKPKLTLVTGAPPPAPRVTDFGECQGSCRVIQ